MIISFFEEFANDKNIEKVKLIDFKSKLYIADYSVEGFKLWKSKVKNKNIIDFIYWPLINVSDGYWFSPFAKKRAIMRSFNELLKFDGDILYDAELPKNRRLMFNKEFFKNRKLIDGFFKKFKGKIYTAEYFLMGGVLKEFAKFFRIEFDPSEYENYVIKMMYSSISNYSRFMKEKIISEGVSNYGERFLVGLGCLAVGINGDEKLISDEKLREDLELCKLLGVREVVLFRLGGLNERYLKVIKEFV